MKEKDTNIRDEELERALEFALELKKKGVPPEQILSRFPKQRRELEPLLLLAEKLSGERDVFSPSRGLVSRILGELDARVTERETARFIRRGYGRTSLVSALERIVMHSSLRFAIPIAAVFVVALALISIQYGGKTAPVSENLSGEPMSAGDGVSESAASPREETLSAPASSPAVRGETEIGMSGAGTNGAAADTELGQMENDFAEFDEFINDSSAVDSEADQLFSEFF